MKGVFVDTAGWMACADQGDPALEQGNVLVTTDYVIDETLTLIRMRLGLAAAKTWWEQLEGSCCLPVYLTGNLSR